MVYIAAVCQCITASVVHNVHDDMVHIRILPPPKKVLVMNCFVLLADRGSLLGLFGRGMGIHVTERFGQLGRNGGTNGAHRGDIRQMPLKGNSLNDDKDFH